MANPSDIVGQINSFLRLGQAKSERHLADLARTYASLCRQANSRLEQCADYLRRGLRTEAIYHAEIQPDLLDMTSALDMTQLTEWNRVCSENSLETSPELHLEIAKQLHQVYVEQEAVKELLKQIRLLALARAPIRERLAALKALAQRDPSSSALLESDIRDFEDARLSEITADAAKAYKTEDIDTLQSLLRELARQSWKHPRATRLRSGVSRKTRAVQVRKAEAQLEALLPDLHAAHGALAFEECKSLMGQWNHIVETNRLTLRADMLEKVRHAEEYVAEVERGEETQRRYAEAVFQLRDALQKDRAALTEIQRLYEHARSFDLPLPDDLENEYGSKISELVLAQRRRNRSIFAASALGVLVVGAVVSLIIYRGILKWQAERWGAQIAAAINDDNLDSAEKLLRTVPDNLRGRDEIETQKDRLGQAKITRADRRVQYRKLIATVMHILGVETHDTPLVEVNTGSLDSAQATLRKAKPLAEGAEQQRTCIKLEAAIQKEKIRRQNELDKAFMAELGKLNELFRKVDPNGPLEEFEGQLKVLGDKMSALEIAHGISPATMASLTPLARRMRSFEDTLAKRKGIAEKERKRDDAEKKKRLREQEDLAGLAYKAHSATPLGEALKKFAAAHPEHPKTPSFKLAASQSVDWAAVQEWDKLIGNWKGSMLPTRAGEISARIEEVKQYSKKHPTSPLNEHIGTYLVFLAKANASLGEESPWKDELPALMRNEIMHLSCFTLDGKKVFYMRPKTEAKRSSLGLVVPVVKGLDLARETNLVYKGMELAEFSKLRKVSPQAKLAEFATGKLIDFDITSWNTVGCDIAEAIQGAKAMDPLLRAALLTDILGYIKDYGWGAEDEVQEALGILRKLQLGDQITWVDPDNVDANRLRPHAATVLRKLMPLSALKGKVTRKRQILMANLQPGGRDCGVAIKEGNVWKVLTRSTLREGNTLWVVAKDRVEGEAILVLRQIGSVSNSKVVIDASAMVDIPEGTMVFIRKKPQAP